MGKYVAKLALLVVLGVGAGSLSASAQVYVKARPAFHRVDKRPDGPHGAVWIDEDWENRGGSYVAVGGHWATPPHPGWVWVAGRWAHERRGYNWIPGRWKRA